MQFERSENYDPYAKKASTKIWILSLDFCRGFSSFISLPLHIFVDAIGIVGCDHISHGTDP